MFPSAAVHVRRVAAASQTRHNARRVHTLLIRPIPGAPLGVEVCGCADISQVCTAATDEMVHAMDSCGGVLVVREQSLSPPAVERAVAAFSRRFGPPLRYDRWPGQSPGVPGCPYLASLGNYRAKEDNQFGMACKIGDRIAEFKPATNTIGEWHTDGSFLAAPKAAIALYAPDIDDALPQEGGETKFANNARALQQLSEDERRSLRQLASVHSWEVFMRLLEARNPAREKVTKADIEKKPDQVWPLIRRSPTTGMQSLYINPKATRRLVEVATGQAPDGMDDAQGVSMVRRLAERVVAPSNVYAHQWRRGDFVIWDNHALLHAASPFDSERYERFLWRMEFCGAPILSASDVA